MRPEERGDEAHFDGGASLLHMGLTLYGRRRMNCKLNDDDYEGDTSFGESFVFTPGNVYIGNLCAAEHVVIHESDYDHSQGLEIGSISMKLTAMLRTPLFAAGHGRTIKTAPSPKVVYARANAVVAQQLRHHCLNLPTFEACLAAEKAIKIDWLQTAGDQEK